jgi:hypothetical protein
MVMLAAVEIAIRRAARKTAFPIVNDDVEAERKGSLMHLQRSAVSFDIRAWNGIDDKHRHDRGIKMIVRSTHQVGKTKEQQALTAT